MKKVLLAIMALGMVNLTQIRKVNAGDSDMLGVPSPEWTKDLVICEISTKNFNSPKKSEAGTFNSLGAKMRYLKDVGITGIWLTGHHHADDKHFYNIWTQYACISPDKLDPSLGTEQDFRNMIDEAHRYGIKIFLDVITHGVMPDSPLVKQHPNWFKGGSWGMVDFDWKAHNKELDDWWVKLYTDYVIDFGVDGYRLDLEIHRPDLWLRIRENAAAAGHPIVVMGELWEYGNYDIPLEGIMDFSQNGEADITPNNSAEYDHNHRAVRDMAGFANSVYNGNMPARPFTVEVYYCDGSIAKGATGGDGPLKVIDNGITADKVGTDSSCPDGNADIEILVEGVDPALTIKNVVVRDRKGVWQMLGNDNWFASVEKQGAEIKIYIAEYMHKSGAVPGFVLANTSMHDVGWEGYPIDENPYVTKFSRGLFGYSSLMSPLIPLFFAGEEFSAEFRPATRLAYSCYEAKDVGKGKWLYGSWIDWSQLDKPEHKSMLKDVSKMLAIRKQEKDIIHGKQRHEKINILPVKAKSNIDVPAPYIQWNKEKAIIVAANYNTDINAELVMNIPVTQIGMGGNKKFIVEDLWNGSKKTVLAMEISNFRCSIKSDKQPAGGIGIWKIEPVKKSK